MQESGL